MEFQRAMQQLRKGEVSPVITLCGTERVLQQQLLQLIYEKVANREELDLAKVDMEESGIHVVLDEAEMFSFFAEKRIVVVERATFLAGQTKQKLSDTEQQRLLDYLANPNEGSVVVFLMPVDQLDKRKKLTKAFQQQTWFVDVSTMSDKAVMQYVEQYITNERLVMTKEAVSELLVRVHYQLGGAMNELSKLQQFAQSGESINIEAVRHLVPRTLETDVFELTKAVLARNVDKAVAIYQDLTLMKNEPTALQALLMAQFRLMIQVQLLSRQGHLEAHIAQQLNVHPYRVKLALQESRRYSLDKLMKLYGELIEADFQMKTSVGIKESQFHLWLIRWVN